jgi:hypothetical protein
MEETVSYRSALAKIYQYRRNRHSTVYNGLNSPKVILFGVHGS